MRDYALNLAAAHDEAGPLNLVRLWRNWRLRHDLRNCHAIAGASREDIRWATNLPLTVNPVLALEDRTFHAAAMARLMLPPIL